MTRFPKPLHPGDLIAVTAPSSGVSGNALTRLDLVLDHLRSSGFRIVEGQCLRNQFKNASASREARAAELTRFLLDLEVTAIMPPWGGELAIELLELIDFEALRSIEPKWLLGFSDLSTLHLPLTLVAGWATAHGTNLMDLAPTQTDPLTTAVLDVLASDLAAPVVQESSKLFQTKWVDFAIRADAPLNLSEPTHWKRLDGLRERIKFQGRLIGGCLDTIPRLAGTSYGDIPTFIQSSGTGGTILYLENVEMSPCGVVRALWSLRLNRWFEGLSGLLIGRSAAPEPTAADSLTYHEALTAVLGDLKCPVIVDVDIGHQAPQFTLINGAFAEVVFDGSGGRLMQWRGGPADN
ncbi:MAG: LD-carboxypeptidase [Proteobacteria bacterium]|nr:LD-carboxypeptidase [Pseudomonadota bacterium]